MGSLLLTPSQVEDAESQLNVAQQEMMDSITSISNEVGVALEVLRGDTATTWQELQAAAGTAATRLADDFTQGIVLLGQIRQMLTDADLSGARQFGAM